MVSYCVGQYFYYNIKAVSFERLNEMMFHFSLAPSFHCAFVASNLRHLHPLLVLAHLDYGGHKVRIGFACHRLLISPQLDQYQKPFIASNAVVGGAVG